MAALCPVRNLSVLALILQTPNRNQSDSRNGFGIEAELTDFHSTK